MLVAAEILRGVGEAPSSKPVNKVPAFGEIESQLAELPSTVALQDMAPWVVLDRNTVCGAGLAPPGVVTKLKYWLLRPMLGACAWSVAARQSAATSRPNQRRDPSCRKY